MEFEDGRGGRWRETSDELHEKKCLKWQQRRDEEIRVDLFFPSSATTTPLIVKFEWAYVERSILGKRLQLRSCGQGSFFFPNLRSCFDLFAYYAFVLFLIMYSTGGIRDLVLCYTFIFFSNEREDFPI